MLTRKDFIGGLAAAAVGLVNALGCRRADPGAVRIDGTSHEAFEQSLARATEGMTDDQRTEIISAIAALWAIRGGNASSPEEAQRGIESGVNGMTVEEVLAAVK